MSNFFLDHTSAELTGVQKIMLATTAYDSPDASYTFAILRGRQTLEEAGFLTSYMMLSGNCHVDDARNRVVQAFLLTDCTDLVFLDADVSWDPKYLVELVSYDCDLVGGIYPYRREGLSVSFNMPILMIPGDIATDDQGLIEVIGLPTGFMRIRRKVLETLCEDARHYANPDDRRSQTPLLFERTLENGTRLGGDLNFCKKWIEAGGSVWAAPEIHLGHATKTINQDSLGAALRRQAGTTLIYVTQELAKGNMDASLFLEALKYANNPYAVDATTLALCVLLAKIADGPILEAGSGLTTILMAAVTDQPIYCLEHDPLWALRLEQMIQESDVSGVGVCDCAIKDEWYDLEPLLPGLPERFALGLNDGPPRRISDRMKFYDQLGDRIDTIIVDDADDPGYRGPVAKWCEANSREIDYIEERTALVRRALTTNKEQIHAAE